jgi:predicted ATPase
LPLRVLKAIASPKRGIANSRRFEIIIVLKSGTLVKASRKQSLLTQESMGDYIELCFALNLAPVENIQPTSASKYLSYFLQRRFVNLMEKKE